MSFNSLLNQTCSIERFTSTQSQTGAISKNWTIISTPKCRLTKRNLSAKGDLASPYSKATHIIYLEKGADILDKDRVVILGKNYDIIVVRKDSSLHHFEVLVQEIVQK